MNEMQPQTRTIDLPSVKLHPAAFEVLTEFKAAGVPQNGLRASDYRRWTVALSAIEDGGELIDVGIGIGQFPAIALRSGKFEQVTGADMRPHSALQKVDGYHFEAYNLCNHPGVLSADVVTCMECIEHIASPDFEKAVEHLKMMTRRQLIVTVPFEEELPLPPYHKQRFDTARMQQLFPGCSLTYLAIEGKKQWVMADWRPQV